MVALSLIVVSALVGANAQERADGPAPLERVAKAATERVLSYVLDTPVVVDKVRLDPKTEVLELTGLRIANPKGFEASNAIVVGSVLLKANPKSLLSREPYVRLAHIQGVAVIAEANLARGLNLKKLLDNASRFQGPDLLKNLTKKRWRIDKGVLEQCTVDITTRLPEKRTSRKTLDRIELEMAGPSGRGLTADEAMARILYTLLREAGLLEQAGLTPLLEVLDR